MDEALRDLATDLATLVASMSQIRDTRLRLKATHDLQELLQVAYRAAVKERRNAMVQMHHGDLARLDEIAEVCGISRQRVEQVLNLPKANRPPRKS
jgi:DNA-directed RNA polymerase specialized sigma subunit